MLTRSLFTRITVLLTLTLALLSLSFSPSRADTASDIKALQSAVKTLQSQVSALQTQNTSLQSQINAVKSVTSGFSRVTDTTRTDGKKGTELFLTGFNLHVVNGLGATNGEPNNPTDHNSLTVNGLGNVIIGYNQTRGKNSSGQSLDYRYGSHNLIVGDFQNYSSFGGVVFGAANDIDIEASYACITGGGNGTASGYLSSISGGNLNEASGEYASVSGGAINTASGQDASITGGAESLASGLYSSISGGFSNEASGGASSVSGGETRDVSGNDDWAAGDLFQDN